MKFTELIITKLLNTSYEDFTSYCITAIAIAKSNDAFNKKDINRMIYLIDNVNDNIKTSVYKLDRFIDSTKVMDDPTKFSYPVTFWSDKIIDEETGDKKKIKISSENLQKMLCGVVQEINTIIYNSMKSYDEDFKMPENSDDDGENYF